MHYPGIAKERFNVGLDVIFVTPANPKFTTEKGTWQKAMESQLPVVEHWFIHSPRAANENTLAILYPRVAGQPAPKVTPVLDGKGFIVEHQSGRDFVFASALPVTYNENGIEFTGKYAIVRDRPGSSSLTLLDGSRLSFKGKTLTEKGSADL